MTDAPVRDSHHPDDELPEELEPGLLPTGPDEGPVPPSIPDDPEHERVIDPGTGHDLQARRVRHPGAAAGWP